MFRKIRITVLHILTGIVFLSSCHTQLYIDPFFGINVDADQPSIECDLKDKLLKRSLQKSIFSFEKTSYIKTVDFDARITGNLSYPVFKQNKLSQLRYTLQVEFKNDQSYSFNPGFYQYLVKLYDKAYGRPFEEKDFTNDIQLKWSLKNGKYITVDVIKDLNTYQVQYQNQNK